MRGINYKVLQIMELYECSPFMSNHINVIL